MFKRKKIWPLHLRLSIESIHRPKRCASNGRGNHINPLKINVIQKLTRKWSKRNAFDWQIKFTFFSYFILFFHFLWDTFFGLDFNKNWSQIHIKMENIHSLHSVNYAKLISLTKEYHGQLETIIVFNHQSGLQF